jgi:hypothetical protein
MVAMGAAERPRRSDDSMSELGSRSPFIEEEGILGFVWWV